MGLLESQKTFDGDVIMGVVPAAVRGYSRAYFGGMDFKYFYVWRYGIPYHIPDYIRPASSSS